MSDLEFVHNTACERYELTRDGTPVAYAQYEQAGPAVVFTHTEVLPGHEGQGVGSRLAKRALDDVRQGGRQVVAQCEFIAAYLRRHPEYADLAVPRERAARRDPS